MKLLYLWTIDMLLPICPFNNHQITPSQGYFDFVFMCDIFTDISNKHIVQDKTWRNIWASKQMDIFIKMATFMEVFLGLYITSVN